MKELTSELPTRLEAGGVCFQGEDWGGINVARVRFPTERLYALESIEVIATG